MQIDYAAPGPYRAGRWRVTVRRPNNSTFTAQLYYPATATGDQTPYDGSGAPYPALSFGHGFLQPPERYRSTLEHLATWGYLVIATESGLELFPNHRAYAEDLRLCLTYLEAQNADPNSTLFRQVAVERFGIFGHSMGGGASILAAAADARIRAVANLAAAETNPSAIQASANVTVPHSLISGSADSITPLNNHGLRMYTAGFAPKLLPVIQGGWHCGFMDSSPFGCDSGSLPRSTQLALTRKLLTAFFELYLRGDLRAGEWVWGDAVRSEPLIQLTADPGMRLLPDYSVRVATTPRVIEHRLQVQNTSRYVQQYQIRVEGNTWRTEARPATTPPVNPSEQVSVSFYVSVPRARRPSRDRASVRVLSLRDGGTQVAATLLTVLK
ncbi:MAG: alpha/beta hydrolase [Armatimonadota bacterium]